MSDERIRKLKIAARFDPEVGAAYLRERVRVGELSSDRVEAAALLGSEHAQRALSWSLIAEGEDVLTFERGIQEIFVPLSPRARIMGMKKFGMEYVFLAARAVSRFMHGLWSRDAVSAGLPAELVSLGDEVLIACGPETAGRFPDFDYDACARASSDALERFKVRIDHSLLRSVNMWPSHLFGISRGAWLMSRGRESVSYSTLSEANFRNHVEEMACLDALKRDTVPVLLGEDS